MNSKLLLILISAIFFGGCDGIKRFCVKAISSDTDTCIYKGALIGNLDTVLISRPSRKSKTDYDIIIRPCANNFDPDSLSIVKNNKRIYFKKIQKEALNGNPYYIFSSFYFTEGDTIIIRTRSSNMTILDTLVLEKEKLFLE